ncbi:MAG TPA: Spy/CpxP family protein refolding chaperone [Gemmatimonadales bacterium]|nr:Spy/CpxP family protein refolding chaperone [Gemmatimonadales bacterium]
MRSIKYAALAATVFYLSVPALAEAQGARGEQAAPRARAERAEMARPDFVNRLLERKAELKLTDDQVTRLTAIQEKYKALNQPHIDAMRANRPDSAQRDSMRKARREQMQAVRENSRNLRSEVDAVLTAEQKAKVQARRRR